VLDENLTNGRGAKQPVALGRLVHVSG
jgi:hypothetical protein